MTRAKSDTEQKLEAAAAQLGAAQSGSKAAQASLKGKLVSAQGAQADLTLRLSEASAQLAATTGKLNDTSRQLAAKETELAQARQGLAQSTAANVSCESKNLTLYTYAQEVLQAYRKKGVWASMAQTGAGAGLQGSRFYVENVVQEYQLKFASQKVRP